MKHLTCYLDLGGSAGSARQYLELLCLVHGVVSACNHQPVSRFPWAYVIHQIQDRAVHIGVNGYRKLWFHWKAGMEGWRIQLILSENAGSFFFFSCLELHKNDDFLMQQKIVNSSKHVFLLALAWKGSKQESVFLQSQAGGFSTNPRTKFKCRS